MSKEKSVRTEFLKTFVQNLILSYKYSGGLIESKKHTKSNDEGLFSTLILNNKQNLKKMVGEPEDSKDLSANESRIESIFSGEIENDKIPFVPIVQKLVIKKEVAQKKTVVNTQLNKTQVNTQANTRMNTQVNKPLINTRMNTQVNKVNINQPPQNYLRVPQQGSPRRFNIQIPRPTIIQPGMMTLPSSARATTTVTEDEALETSMISSISEESIQLGSPKIDKILEDKTVQTVECPGPNKQILVYKSGAIQASSLTLTNDEISTIMKEVSERSRIPLMSGVFKAAIGNLVITAVMSEFVGTRFIVQKKQPAVPPQN